MINHRRTWDLKPLSTRDYHQLTSRCQDISPINLSYVIFAGPAVCEMLKICNRGYRVIISSQPEHLAQTSDPTLALIVRIDAASYPSDSLLASHTIIHQHGCKVFIKRINLGLTRLDNQIVPKLPSATQIHLYFNSQSLTPTIISDLLPKTAFVITNKCIEYFMHLSTVKGLPVLSNNRPEILTTIRRAIGENLSNKYTNYLRISIKGSSSQLSPESNQQLQHLLFEPNKTKLQIHKANHYRLNDIVKFITLPPLYSQIFSHSASYQQLTTLIEQQLKQRPDKRVILLKTGSGKNSGKGLGISSFLHHISQQHSFNFLRINCKYFVTVKELLDQVRSVENCSGSLIYVKNVEWLTELGNDKNDSQEKMKRILRSVEDEFVKMGDSSLSSHVLVISCPGGEKIKLDMTKNAILQIFSPQKQERIELLQQTLNFYKSANKLQLAEEEQAINLVVNNIGWVQFSKILNNLIKSKILKPTMEEIVREIGKVSEMEKVENIKNVSWDDVGGLEHAKQEIIQTILLPSKHPEIFDQWIKPRTGLLFYGPPGTGKTMLGKCIANQCKMGFISVKGPELLNMYIGQSEKNVREVFERAYASKPCIVFMDQLDALIPKRGQSSDSNQVMDRIVSELLMQMDKAAGNGVFIIGATNRPDLLDPSIMRPGRFDKQIYLGIAKDSKSRLQIMKAQTRNIKLVPDFDFERIIQKVPDNFTGADFYGLTSRSIMRAAERYIEEYEKSALDKKLEDRPQGEVMVSEQDFLETLTSIKPSVSNKELAHYERLRQEYK